MGERRLKNTNSHEESIRRVHTNDVSEMSKQAYQLLRESLTDRAAGLFRRILETEPENNYALVGLGDALRKERRYEEALRYYEECLKSHPGNNYALFGIADCHKSLGSFSKAIEAWEEYLHHDDSNVTVLTRVADAYRKVRDYRKSADLYERVLELDPDNSYALIGLGHLHYDFKEYAEALDRWKAMEKRGGRNVDIRVLTSIGNCYRKLKEYQEGIPYFERALEKQPGNFYALFGMADCYRGMHETERSLFYWNTILEKDPKNKVILTRAGDAHRAMGDLESAESCYRKALDIAFDIYAAMGLALVDRALGKTESALSDLTDLISEDPKNHRLYIESASCLEELGLEEEAVGILLKFREQGLHNEQIEEYLQRLGGG